MGGPFRTSGSTPASCELSLILSCFNQAEALEAAVRDSLRVAQLVTPHFEVLVINDGSTDGSVRILDRLRKESPHLRVTHQLPSGRSRALRRGYELARGTHVFQMDLDYPQAILELPRFWDLRLRYDLVLGYHADRGNRLDRAAQWILKRWTKLWFGAEFTEADARFRLCRRQCILDYLHRIPVDFEGLDLALTLAAHRDVPRRVLEVEIAQTSPAPARHWSRELSQLPSYFSEIVTLWWKRPPVLLEPAPKAI